MAKSVLINLNSPYMAFNIKYKLFHSSLTVLNWKMSHSKKMLGCFNPILGQIWTIPAIGLHFLITFFNPVFEFVHI